jgi:hypothetical protein
MRRKTSHPLKTTKDAAPPLVPHTELSQWYTPAVLVTANTIQELGSLAHPPAVRAAAANYGALGEANGVHVGFANLNTGANPTYGSVDASGSVGGMPLIQVTIDFGRAGSAETQTHEGTHVGDDQKFLKSFNPLTGGYDQSLSLTHGQTEFNAFRAGAFVNQEHGFGPNDTQKILNFLHSSPYYGPIFNSPVFDPSRFPAGVHNDEQ